MKIRCVWEHHGDDSLLYAENFIGAFTRGENKEICCSKMANEIVSYLRWLGEPVPDELIVEIVQEKSSELNIRDADSDVLFDAEKENLSLAEYECLKRLALKSAEDFQTLFDSIPDRSKTCLPPRQTFYGNVPRSAEEMYRHTKSVNSYYFGEIGVDIDNEGSIVDCRKRGFELLETKRGFLQNEMIDGSYGEQWSLRKVLRRFVWHDRIHAKAMYRMAIKTFGRENVNDVFGFKSIVE